MSHSFEKCTGDVARMRGGGEQFCMVQGGMSCYLVIFNSPCTLQARLVNYNKEQSIIPKTGASVILQDAIHEQELHVPPITPIRHLNEPDEIDVKPAEHIRE